MSPPQSVGGLKASFVSNGSSHLAVRQWDAGGTPILALHPGVTDSRVWQECARVWADAGHRVVAYDRRGFGSTAWAEEPHDPLCDLSAVTAATNCRPAVVVGNSKGGALGFELALAHPEEVLALVVIGSVPDDTPDDLMNGTALRAISTGDVTATRPVWPVLESLAVPTFLVVGEYDLPGFAVVAAAIADRVSHAQVVILEGTAHLPPLDAPAAVAAVVLDVVAGVSMSPPQGLRDAGPDHTPALP